MTQRSRAFIALVAAFPLFGGVASCSDPVAGPCEEYNDHYDEHIMAMEGSLADNPEEWRESQRLLAACKESGGDPHTGDVRLGQHAFEQAYLVHRQSPREPAVLKTDGTTRARAFEHSCNRVLAAHPLTHSDGGNPLDRLLESLGSWADAREVTGGIEVTFRRRAGGRRTVELVLTRPDVVVLMDIRMPGVSPPAGLRAADTGRSMRVEAFDRVRFSRE